MGHSWTRASALAFMSLVVAASPVSGRSAAEGGRMRVLLDGRPATIGAAARSHCEDLTPGVLECFATSRARDLAVSARGKSSSAASSGYVVAYVNASFGGASIVMSQDYANLGTIGWNDRISSYKVYTSLTGYFYQNSNYSGLAQSYCCFSQVSYVGNAYNDTFSSLSIP